MTLMDRSWGSLSNRFESGAQLKALMSSAHSKQETRTSETDVAAVQKHMSKLENLDSKFYFTA